MVEWNTGIVEYWNGGNKFTSGYVIQHDVCHGMCVSYSYAHHSRFPFTEYVPPTAPGRNLS